MDSMAYPDPKGDPRIENRTVFLTLVAPTRPMKTSAIGQVVWRRCQIAGVEPVRAHRLRHALATDLLANGVRLPEIAQVLRQRDLATTAIYANPRELHQMGDGNASFRRLAG